MRFREFLQNEELDSQAVGSIIDRSPANPIRQSASLQPQQPMSIMSVGSGKIDARISVIGFDKAYEGMLRACNQILSDESAQVQVVGDDGTMKGSVPWGRLYFLSQDNNPRRKFIEIEYSEQATKGLMGDLAYTAGWMMNNPARPLRWAAEKTGLATNPEKFYLSQFVKELQRLVNEGILFGLQEWNPTTSYLGRNILIVPTSK